MRKNAEADLCNVYSRCCDDTKKRSQGLWIGHLINISGRRLIEK